jgi:aminoglycoside phosphotransferase (APT) family kinase protein
MPPEQLHPDQWPAHGFSDDESTRRLLRSRPPDQSLIWAGSVLGGTVTSTRALRGGISSAVHLLGVRLDGGETAQVVLRRYVRPEITSEVPDIAGREARILRFVAGAPLPTPDLLGVDPVGSEAGVPAVLMSYLAGRVDWFPSDLDRWLERLAELLAVIHATVLPPGGASSALPNFSPYEQSVYEPPDWARWPDVWERAFEVFHGPEPQLSRTFIQRDFHPGNVLWRRGSVSGVVDWQAACEGPPTADVGHCRTNLYRYGLEAADRFTDLWERLTGRSYDPWSEIVSIVGILDELRRRRRPDSVSIEDALSRAVAALG